MRRYSALRKFLRHANRPAGTLTYHQLQGFLFAVGSAPELVRPSEWLPLVFNDQEAVYESMDEARTILGEIMRLYNEVNAGIFEERAALPPDCRFRKAVLDNLDESAPVCQWAHGFLVGHQWLQDLWEVDLSEDLDQELGAALLALSFFASRRLAEAFRAEQAPNKSLESLAESIRSVFPDALVSYAQLGRGLGSAPHGAGPDVPPGRPRASVGRNAPCPCGSGRKFKKCCGASVH